MALMTRNDGTHDVDGRGWPPTSKHPPSALRPPKDGARPNPTLCGSRKHQTPHKTDQFGLMTRFISVHGSNQ